MKYIYIIYFISFNHPQKKKHEERMAAARESLEHVEASKRRLELDKSAMVEVTVARERHTAHEKEAASKHRALMQLR